MGFVFWWSQGALQAYAAGEQQLQTWVWMWEVRLGVLDGGGWVPGGTLSRPGFSSWQLANWR